MEISIERFEELLLAEHSANLLINCIMNNTRLGYDKNSLTIFGDAEIIHLLEAFGVDVDERI